LNAAYEVMTLSWDRMHGRY